MIKAIEYLFSSLLILIILSGCNILNPSIMFKTSKNFKFDELNDSIPSTYKISPNDIISLRVFTNDGFKLIDVTSLSTNKAVNQNILNIDNGFKYLVKQNGYAKLPILGETKLAGFTEREAELMLEEKYSKYYNRPFVLLKVLNKRVIVFPGAKGAAKVLTLQNDNTTLVEALAMAGGIVQTGKAYKIKLIRGPLSNPKVYLFDLSTIDGAKHADVVLQANDIIYVDPIQNTARIVVKEISPYISILTSLFTLYWLITRITPR